MDMVFAFQSGAGAAAKYTAQAPPDYWNTIGPYGILQILTLFGGIILVASYILSVLTKRRRRYPPETED